jgi:hypothetical protein
MARIHQQRRIHRGGEASHQAARSRPHQPTRRRPGRRRRFGAQMEQPLLAAGAHGGGQAAMGTLADQQPRGKDVSVVPIEVMTDDRWGQTQQATSLSRTKGVRDLERCCHDSATGWQPFAIIWVGMAVACSVWPYQSWRWQRQHNCEIDQLGSNLRPWIENALGWSAVTGRAALMSAVATQVAAFVFGFAEWPGWCPACTRARDWWRRARRCLHISDSAPIGADGGEVAADHLAQSIDEVLQRALTPAELREQARPRVESFLKQRDQSIARTHRLELASARQGFLKTLLTGHGPAPVPRMAAGWLAIVDEGTAQAHWNWARRELGLTWWRGSRRPPGPVHR